MFRISMESDRPISSNAVTRRVSIYNVVPCGMSAILTSRIPCVAPQTADAAKAKAVNTATFSVVTAEKYLMLITTGIAISKAVI